MNPRGPRKKKEGVAFPWLSEMHFCKKCGVLLGRDPDVECHLCKKIKENSFS